MRHRTSLVLTSAALLLVLSSTPTAPASDDEPRTPAIGEAAPDFRLPGVDGKDHALSDFASAKLLAVVFTCNHCPTAQAYEERLKKLVADYRDRGVAFVAISPNDPRSVRLDELGYTDLSDSFEEMKVRAADRKFNFPYLYDGETEKTSRAYGPAATPHLFLFDAERKLRYSGRIDDSEREKLVKTQDARNALDALLAGKPVPVEKTRTFGCSIKWASKRESVKRAEAAPALESIRLEAAGPEELRSAARAKSEKLRLVNLWATWCGPCVKEFPELVTMQRMYGHRAFEVITVSADDPEQGEKVLSFLRKQGAVTRNFHFRLNQKDPLGDALDPDWPGALPHTVLISPEGKVLYRRTGEIDALEVRRAIVKNLAEDRWK